MPRCTIRAFLGCGQRKWTHWKLKYRCSLRCNPSGKARIVQRGIGGAPRQGFPKSRIAFDHSDAAAQFLGDVQSHKQSAALRENARRWKGGKWPLVANRMENALARKLQDRYSIFFREGRHLAASSAIPACSACGAA